MALSVQTIPGVEDTRARIREIAAVRRKAMAEYFVPFPNKDSDKYLANIVMQGGGVLGLAHAGFLFGLETAGVRCAALSGTSAGAIVVTAIACLRGGSLSTEVSEKMFDIIASMPMESFIDGQRPIVELITHVLKHRGLPPMSLWPAVWTAVRELLHHRGLNPGRRFELWLEDLFIKNGVPTNEVLMTRLDEIRAALGRYAIFDVPSKVIDGQFVVDRDTVDRMTMLRVVATGLPSGLKIAFPEDLHYLDKKYMQASPALFVRASMAIPAFFRPQNLEVDKARWLDEVQSRLGGLLAPNQITDVASVDHLYLVDGGLLSNVPVDAFELMMRKPRGRGRKLTKFPTIVATLTGWKPPPIEASWRSPKRVLSDVMRLAQAVRLQRDRDAWRRVLQSGDMSVRIVDIDASERNWLNFTMSDEEKGKLFVKGLNRAARFLQEL